VRTVKFYYS